MYFFTWFLNYYFRPILKWFLRKTTGLCELQRICYGTIRGAARTHQVENSLNLSRTPEIIKMVEHLNSVSENQSFQSVRCRDLLDMNIQTVIFVKKINPRVHVEFSTSFGQCLEIIWKYKQLLAQVESLRTTFYDSDNFEHEEKLLLLWKNLVPTEELENRITKQWHDIGFQGEDPKTDFRGMGVLGLENLLYFASEQSEASAQVLSHSHHPTYGYAFAIVGINITHLAWSLLKQGDAKTYFYNLKHDRLELKDFHQFYSFLFYEFDKYWIEAKPVNIMEFSRIKESFEKCIRNALQDPSSVFRLNLTVETI